MKSLRTRLLLGTCLSISLILLAAGLAVYSFVHKSLLATFDQSLRETAGTIAMTTERNAQGKVLDPEAAQTPQFSNDKRPDYFQMWRADRSPVISSKSLAGRNLEFPLGMPDQPVSESLQLPDGKPGRQVSLRFVPRPEEEEKGTPSTEPLLLVVARHTHDVDETLERLRWILLFVGLGAILAAALSLNFAVSRGLRPLAGLAARISEIGQANLSDRVQLHGTPAELATVVERLNGLLTRLEQAVLRERGFTADVAHELRTPLGGLESTLSVCLMRGRSSAEYHSTVNKCMAIVRSMHSMVDNLLMLARVDSGQLKLEQIEVDLGGLLEDCWTPFRQRAIDQKLHVIFDLQDNLIVRTDPDKLRIVFNNVLDNATSYCDVGGHIVIAAREHDRRACISVTNTGSRLSADQLNHIFARFWRGDDARSATGTHCGLGLSLCKKITELLGGQIRAAAPAENEFNLTLNLPLPAGSKSGPRDNVARLCATPGATQ